MKECQGPPEQIKKCRIRFDAAFSFLRFNCVSVYVLNLLQRFHLIDANERHVKNMTYSSSAGRVYTHISNRMKQGLPLLPPLTPVNNKNVSICQHAWKNFVVDADSREQTTQEYAEPEAFRFDIQWVGVVLVGIRIDGPVQVGDIRFEKRPHEIRLQGQSRLAKVDADIGPGRTVNVLHGYRPVGVGRAAVLGDLGLHFDLADLEPNPDGESTLPNVETTPSMHLESVHGGLEVATVVSTLYRSFSKSLLGTVEVSDTEIETHEGRAEGH